MECIHNKRVTISILVILIQFLIIRCDYGDSRFTRNTMRPSSLNIRFVSWINNAPYVYSNEEHGRRLTEGIIISAVKMHLKMHFRNAPDFKYIDDPMYYLQTEQELKQLIGETNITKVFHKLNTTSNSTGIIILQATTHYEGKGNIFSPLPVIQTESAVVIVRTSDILLLNRFLKGIGSCTGVIFFAITCAVNLAALIWIIECKTNSDFQNTFGAGLWTSFWYCFVTMTTVGYGDKVPKHWISRLLCLAWMLFGLMLTAIITTAVMEAVQSEFPKAGKKIAVTESKFEKNIIRTQFSAIPVTYQNYEEVIEALRLKEVDAALMEASVAATIFKHQHTEDLKMETELVMKTWVYVYVYYNQQFYGQIHFEDSEKRLSDSITSMLRAQFVPPYKVTRYYTRSFLELFNKQDGGLVFYLSIVAGCMVASGALSEVVLRFRGRLSGKTRQTYVKELFKMSTQNEKIKRLEKNFQEVIEDLKKEFEQKCSPDNTVVKNDYIER